MTIRPAENKDIDIIVKILRQACATVAERFGLTLENCPKSPAFYTHQRAEDDFARGVRYFLLSDGVQDGACVAMEQAKPGVVYLERLAVLPAQRGQGFGSALVRYVLDQSKALGAARVEIGVISEDTQLKTWYERFGFAQTGTKTFEHLPFTVAFMAVELSTEADTVAGERS